MLRLSIKTQLAGNLRRFAPVLVSLECAWRAEMPALRLMHFFFDLCGNADVYWVKCEFCEICKSAGTQFGNAGRRSGIAESCSGVAELLCGTAELAYGNAELQLFFAERLSGNA